MIISKGFRGQIFPGIRWKSANPKLNSQLGRVQLLYTGEHSPGKDRSGAREDNESVAGMYQGYLAACLPPREGF